MKEILGLKFQPYIGKNFGKQSDNRILFLAESFYEKDITIPTKNHTTELIEEFLDEEDYKTYETMGKLFDKNDCRKIWDDIAFENFIQRFMRIPRELPTKEDIEEGNKAFKILLDALMPNKVIVFSKRVYNNWLTEDNGTYIGPIELESGEKSTIWKYMYNGGECFVTGIKHPSRIKGDAQIEAWSKLVQNFLKY